MVGGCSFAVTRMPGRYQCADTATIAAGLGIDVASCAQACVHEFFARLFMGLPCPTKSAGMRICAMPIPSRPAVAGQDSGSGGLRALGLQLAGWSVPSPLPSRPSPQWLSAPAPLAVGADVEGGAAKPCQLQRQQRVASRDPGAAVHDEVLRSGPTEELEVELPQGLPRLVAAGGAQV